MNGPNTVSRNTRRRSPGSESPSYTFALATIDRLNHEKADLLEEVRQLRAAVSIYRRIAEEITANRMVAEPPSPVVLTPSARPENCAGKRKTDAA